MAAKRVAIIGGGVGGLAAALALKGSGHEVVIVERDPEPPTIAPELAFEAWPRPGVPQFRHAHILLSRIQTLLREHHPELLAELQNAGLELSTLEEVLPSNVYSGIEPMPGDADLLHLWGRRATFEYVIRQHVGRLPHVRFIHLARVVGLLSEVHENTLQMRGLEFTRGDQREVLEADLVVDASGKRSKVPEWLQEKGVRIAVDSKPSDFVYSCRHYRLRDPDNAPPRQAGGGNFDYLGYATFYAEHGNYALTFGCPVDETELSEAIRRPEGFEALCEQLPVLKQWTSASEATSKVLGAGQFENRWTRYGVAGGLAVRGFFALGDSHVETNPMYGRGCAAAFMQAQVFAEALQTKPNAAEQAEHYYATCRTLLQPYVELSTATDRMYHTRAKLRRGVAVSLAERLMNYAYEVVWLPATHKSPLMAREFLRSMQMRDRSGPLIQFAVLGHLLSSWLRSWFRREPAPAVPARAEFLRKLAATLHKSDNST